MRNKSETETEAEVPKLRCDNCGNEDMANMSWFEEVRIDYPISMDGTSIVINKDEFVDEDMQDRGLCCGNCYSGLAIPAGLTLDYP